MMMSLLFYYIGHTSSIHTYHYFIHHHPTATTTNSFTHTTSSSRLLLSALSPRSSVVVETEFAFNIVVTLAASCSPRSSVVVETEFAFNVVKLERKRHGRHHCSRAAHRLRTRRRNSRVRDASGRRRQGTVADSGAEGRWVVAVQEYGAGDVCHREKRGQNCLMEGTCACPTPADELHVSLFRDIQPHTRPHRR